MFQEAELLRENGHEVYFFCTDKEPYYYDNYEYVKYFPKHTNKFLRFYQLFYNREAVEKFSELLDDVKPDIVHEHTITFHLTPAILNECYKRKIPVVRTIHSFETVVEKNRGICLKSLFSKGILAFYDLMKYYDGAKYLIFPSKALAERGLQRNIPAEKIVTVYNFVKCSNYEAFQNKNGKKGEYFLYVGRLAKEKGLYVLLNVWKQLPEEIELHIAGTGQEELNLKKLIHKNNLKNVKMVGFKEGDGLKKEYAGCIASILPAIWFEPFGLTILESFCFKKPVIASNIGGIPEIIQHNRNGILIEPGNVRELKEAVLKLYNNPDIAEKMGAKGKQTVETIFTPQAHYEGLMRIYEKIGKNFIYK